jgi:hypothetical protein
MFYNCEAIIKHSLVIASQFGQRVAFGLVRRESIEHKAQRIKVDVASQRNMKHFKYYKKRELRSLFLYKLYSLCFMLYAL